MKIAAIQICSTLEPETNLKKIRNFLEVAKTNDVSAVFLPEYFYSLSDGTKATPYLVENENIHFQNIKKLATDFGLMILGGTAATKVGNKIYNRSYNFDRNGKLIGIYDKNHLFSCDIKGKDGHKIDEADIYTPGTEKVILNCDGFRLGLSVCFDLRFPEIYTYYAKNKADLISISSAFTVPTGKAHWHTLVRARAIETQLFVVAACQWGKHNDRIETFGHSLIVSPWGEILADAENGEKIIIADIDFNQIKEIRSRVKVFA